MEGPGGQTYPVTLDRRSFALALRHPLYEAAVRGLALRMIHDVAGGRFEALGRPLLRNAFAIGRDLSIGGYLTIACAESVVGVTMADVERASAGTFLGTARAAPIVNACRFWPTAKVPAWLHEPVSSDVPALLFGGTRDPATPLVGLMKARVKLTNAQSVVVPGAGHDVGGPCTDTILAAFLAHPLEKVDTACVKPIVSHFDPAPVKLTTAQLDLCTGRFRLAPDLVLTVSREGEALVVQATGQEKVGLEARSPTRFRAPGVGIDFEFELGPDGRAKGVELRHGGEHEIAERVP